MKAKEQKPAIRRQIENLSINELEKGDLVLSEYHGQTLWLVTGVYKDKNIVALESWAAPKNVRSFFAPREKKFRTIKNYYYAQ